MNEFKKGWYGIEMEISVREIDELVSLLKMIKDDPEQHFHISRENGDTGRIADIEISSMAVDREHNMLIMGKALLPGEEIDL